MRYHLTPVRMAIIKKYTKKKIKKIKKNLKKKKSIQITNAGEGVEKREPSYTIGGNVS